MLYFLFMGCCQGTQRDQNLLKNPENIEPQEPAIQIP